MFNNFMPFFHRLKHRIAYSVRSFFKTDEQQELLKTVNTHLLIWNNELLNLHTGARAELADMQADTIASVIKQMAASESKNKQTMHVALYLPNTEFVATEYKLPEIATPNIASALSYQISELMPAYPGQLMLAVNHDESRDENIALWLDHARTEALFTALKQASIELTAIVPRIMLAAVSTELLKKSSSIQLREQDDTNLLQITLNNQSLTEWRSISQSDKKDEAYFQQWQEQAPLLAQAIEINQREFWLNRAQKSAEQLPYVFFPEAARRNLKKHSRLKKGRLAILAGVIAVLLVATPFIKNSLRYARWEKRYQDYKQQTIEVRKMRSAVTRFEDNWAVFIDYPKVDTASIITRLNKIIPKNSWIKGFEIKGDKVEIDGYSPNPTSILELISRQPEFTQVAFNQRTQSERGKSNEHFGITFRLKNIDVEAYQEKYFPVN